MDVPPPHVLLQLDAIIIAQRESDANENADENRHGERTASSRF